MTTNEEKISVIAKRYVGVKTDNRPFSVVFPQMVAFAKKGWLNQAFIDGAYSAIMEGKTTVFFHDPVKNLYGYLAGTKQAMEDFAKTNPKNWKFTQEVFQ